MRYHRSHLTLQTCRQQHTVCLSCMSMVARVLTTACQDEHDVHSALTVRELCSGMQWLCLTSPDFDPMSVHAMTSVLPSAAAYKSYHSQAADMPTHLV